MAKQDIFGYDKPALSSGQVASADYAVVSAGGVCALVQSVDASYTQKIEEISQVGDTQIYWLPGRPQGKLDISKLVGTGGFFKGFELGNCGKIDSAKVNVSGGRCGFKGDGMLSFSGGVVETVSMRVGTQQQTIAETISIKVSSMTK